MTFNENSRVKIPAILHLNRLGYEYLSLRDATFDEKNNIILTDIFKENVLRINSLKNLAEDDVDRILKDILLELENEDLGKKFYERLVNQSGNKIIDLENFNNNSFHVVTELTYKKDNDEFRPDIVLLINGLPLAFVEVKKPNNQEGILAEYNRINSRFQNKNLQRFANITQVMVFSNNMEYNQSSISPIDGVFYATPSYEKHDFNYFREEESLDQFILSSPSEELENYVLKDTNLQDIQNEPEFITNKDPNTPTHRLLTSLFSRERLQFLLRYAIAYVREESGPHKHIMRYPQIFATKAIAKRLDEGMKKGIIWHTQGSGKTALAFYNVKFLTDYYHKRNITPKFYFIVDRIDLLEQAQKEFNSRGLMIHTIDSKEDFAQDIKVNTAIHNPSGKPEITVVNIQKFKDDPDVEKMVDYSVDIQRIYFLDEVHRSYKPTGIFLVNLHRSDVKAIKIGLTGTPLLGDQNSSRSLFGDYIHKYYYNASIADGYTLRLIREEIATSYKLTLDQTLASIKIAEGDIDQELLFAHRQYVEPLLDYILQDFEASRRRFDDPTIGGMIVCHSSKQAKKMYEIFQAQMANTEQVKSGKKTEYQVKTAALILHDVGTKEDQKRWVEEFKAGKIDLLFVFRMLLTGFDAKRLKKMYLGRVIKDHNLLQTLTRVNRPYHDFQYGFVVDFADIRKEFDATNQAYFNELQAELGDELEHYSNLFKSKDEIEAEIEEIQDILFDYDIKNAEVFSQQINQIDDRSTVLELKKALGNAKSLYNLIRLLDHRELLGSLDFHKLNDLYKETSNRLDNINLHERIKNSSDKSNLLNEALEDVVFSFEKVGEEELVLADQLKNTVRCTRETLNNNFDKGDPQFVTLQDELLRLLKQKNINEVDQGVMNENINILNQIYKRAKELNRKNDLLNQKYDDAKYVRVHKRIQEWDELKLKDRQLCEILLVVKNSTDNLVSKNQAILKNEQYFNKEVIRLLILLFNEQGIELDLEKSKFINKLIVQGYLDDRNREARA